MNRRFPIIPLDTVSFIMGFNATLAQIVLIRELLTVARGNEFIIGFIYASWFSGIAMGARWGRNPSRKGLSMHIVASLVLLPFIFLGAIIFIYFSPWIIPRAPGGFYHFSMELLLSLVLTAPVSFFVGFFFPPCVVLVASHRGDHAGGRVYSLESLGSFFAALLFAFILVDYLNPLSAAAIMAALGLFTAIPLVTTRRISMLLAIPGCLFVVFLFYTPYLERVILHSVWEHSRPGALLEYGRSRYQFIALEEAGGQISLYGDNVLYGSYPDGYESRYPFHLIAALSPVEHPSVLLFGAGSGSLPLMLAQGLEASITVVDIDPAIHELLARHLPSLYPGYSSKKRIRHVNADMRRHLIDTTEKYDVIVSFPPPPHNAMINRYYTAEYFAKCKSRLNRGGVMIMALPGFDSYLEETQRAFIASIVKSYEEVFPHPIIAAGEKIYYAGYNDDAIAYRWDASSLMRHYRTGFGRINVDAIDRSIAEGLRPEELGLLFEETQLKHFTQSLGPLRSSVSRNSDASPDAFWRYLLYSSRQEGSVFYTLFRRFWIILSAAGALLLAALAHAWRRYGARQTAAGMLMGITGFVSMTTVLLLILLYQNRYGYIYSRIALIQALTMGGLAVGAAAGRMMRSSALPVVFVLLGLGASAIMLLVRIPHEAFFWILLLFISFLCGTVFPLLYRLICPGGHLAAAAVLDSMDFMGALCGSLIAAVLIPSMGINTVAVACVLLCLTTLPVCAFFLRSS